MKQKQLVVVMLGSQCNKEPRCKSCYLPKIDRLGPGAARDRVRKLRQLKHPVRLTGGEVLMEPKYLACYAVASQNYILTNGILLNEDPALFGLLRENGIEEIRFSLNFDISAELDTTDPGLVEKAIGAAKANGFDVGIATLITAKNWTDVARYCGEARRLGAKDIRFYRFLPATGARLGAEHYLPPELIDEFFSLVRKARQEHDGTLRVIPHLGFGPTQGAKEKLGAKGEEYCTAGKSMVALMPDGTVYGCPFLIRPGMELGKLTEHRVTLDKGILGRRDYCLAARLHEISEEKKG